MNKAYEYTLSLMLKNDDDYIITRNRAFADFCSDNDDRLGIEVWDVSDDTFKINRAKVKLEVIK